MQRFSVLTLYVDLLFLLLGNEEGFAGCSPQERPGRPDSRGLPATGQRLRWSQRPDAHQLHLLQWWIWYVAWFRTFDSCFPATIDSVITDAQFVRFGCNMIKQRPELDPTGENADKLLQFKRWFWSIVEKMSMTERQDLVSWLSWGLYFWDQLFLGLWQCSVTQYHY